MISVVGFEGAWPDTAQVAWGAALLDDGTRIINSISGMVSDRSELAGYLGSHAATPLPNAQSFSDDDLAGCVVMAVRRNFPYADLFKRGQDPESGVIRTPWSKNANYIIFRDVGSFSNHANTVAQQAFLVLSRNEVKGADAQAVLSAALTVAQSSPHLLGFKAAYSAIPAARVLLRQRCRSVSVGVFDDIVAALTREGGTYEVKYDGGIAADGGLDVQVASRQLGALTTIQKRLVEEVQASSGLDIKREEVPPIHLREMAAASATLKFDTSAKSETPLARYLRYLEMKSLRSVLSGDVPDGLRSDGTFLDALDRFACPDGETNVRHQGFGDREFVPVKYRARVSNDFLPAETLSGFGYIEGVFERFGKIEVAMVPAQMYKMSSRDNGDGDPPEGVAKLSRTNDFLYRPCQLSIRRYVAPQGETRITLRSITVLEEGQLFAIDFVPSTVVPGALVSLPATLEIVDRDVRLRWTHTKSEISIGGTGESQDGAHTWLKEFQSKAREMELQMADSAEMAWLVLGRRERPSFELHCLAALRDLAVPSTSADWWRAVSEKMGREIPRQKLVQVARTRTDLFANQKEAGQLWSMTDHGRQVGTILRRSGYL